MNWRLNDGDSGKDGVRNDNEEAKRLQHSSPLRCLLGLSHYVTMILDSQRFPAARTKKVF